VDEFLEVIRMPLSEALLLLRQGRITDAKTMVGIFWADKLRRGEWDPRV
jgi:ADP-ribose pyrophosphatase